MYSMNRGISGGNKILGIQHSACGRSSGFRNWSFSQKSNCLQFDRIYFALTRKETELDIEQGQYNVTVQLTRQTIVVEIIYWFSVSRSHILGFASPVLVAHFAEKCIVIIINRSTNKSFFGQTRRQTIFAIIDLNGLSHKTFQTRISCSFKRVRTI